LFTILTLSSSLTLGGCFGNGEPAEAEMRKAFTNAFTSDKTMSEVKISDFRKLACKQSPSRPGYVCDFFADASAKTPLMPLSIRRNLTGRFFVGQNSELEFALEQG
jgi:hypothetical protein